MAYMVENALFQWEDGERRVRDADERYRFRLDEAVFSVIDELRRRLGSSFSLAELIALYAGGTDWASDIASARSAGTAATAVVDAAFARYAREAADYWVAARTRSG